MYHIYIYICYLFHDVASKIYTYIHIITQVYTPVVYIYIYISICMYGNYSTIYDILPSVDN